MSGLVFLKSETVIEGVFQFSYFPYSLPVPINFLGNDQNITVLHILFLVSMHALPWACSQKFHHRFALSAMYQSIQSSPSEEEFISLVAQLVSGNTVDQTKYELIVRYLEYEIVEEIAQGIRVEAPAHAY